MSINELIDVIYSDDYRQTDMSIMTLEEWVMFAKLVQSFKDLSQIQRVIIPGRVTILLRDAGVCDRETFNKLLVEAGVIDLKQHYWTMFDRKPIYVTVFPDDTGESIWGRIDAEI
jgi:hypothetical protein